MATSTGQSQKAERQTEKSASASVKETIESIVVAFILAFIFRAFIVEAFVIPTGSMATTLYGAQLTETCSTCGYEYSVGVPQGFATRRDVSLRCPNCDFTRDVLQVSELRRPNSGDRILVHKWPLDVGGPWLGPKRWDVTVFKDPRDGQTNFIKRLVGKPGEVLEIINGDIYVAPLEELTEKKPLLVDQLDKLRRKVYAMRAGGSRAGGDALLDEYAEVNASLLPYFEIQRKPLQSPEAQEELWINVYNHDFLPSPDDERVRVGWEPDIERGLLAAEAWNTQNRTITFDSDTAQPLYIRFSGKPIDDYSVYNTNNPGSASADNRRLVGDLRLRFSWLPREGTGGIEIEMNRHEDQFTVRLEVDGTVVLERARYEERERGWGRPEEIRRIPSPVPFLSGQAVRVELANVDYRVSLHLDDEEVMATRNDEYRPSESDLRRFIEADRQPSLADRMLPSEVRIGAWALACELRHVHLQRDVFYRCQGQHERQSISGSNPYSDWPGWGTAGLPIMLRNDRTVDGERYHGEYFMLGDNSPASKDSRLWWEIGPHLRELGEEYQVGTVPADQLIGKAFFVYWPAGYRASWAGGLALIPNFGRLRWIE